MPYFNDKVRGIEPEIGMTREEQDLGRPNIPIPPPSSGETPGPTSSPGGQQQGDPQAPPPPPPPPSPSPPPPRTPPAIGSTIQDVEGSTETGGVRGSFAQAGTADFNRRFGGNAPALWYRRTLENLGAPTLRQAQTSRSGGGGGAVTPAPSAAGVGGTDDEVGGRPGDQDWQRFMAQVRRNMFGEGI